jgi:hypothetical protein
MNRRDRRAAEARARHASGAEQGFAEYSKQARRSYARVTDQELGTAWMRWQAWQASGNDSMVIHPKGQSASPSTPDDIRVSAAYGAIKFKAFVAPRLITELTETCEEVSSEVIKKAAQEGKTVKDHRTVTRSCVLEWLLAHEYGDGDSAALLTAAILWLATTATFGAFDGSVCKGVHYEITDIINPANGRKGNNFRLVLSTEQDDTIPDVVRDAPSPYGQRDEG